MGKFIQALSAAWLLTLMAELAGCDDTEKKPPAAAAVPIVPLTVGGSVTGLSGSGLILQLNGANDLAVNASGKFSFPKGLSKGSTYTVTAKASPTTPVKQTCTVNQGNGSIASTSVNNVVVTCTTNSYAVGGTVSGLSGKGLVLQLNGANEQEITRNGNFLFTGAHLPDGSDYSVAIKTMPAKQKCLIKPVSAAFDNNTLNIVAVTCSKKGRS